MHLKCGPCSLMIWKPLNSFTWNVSTLESNGMILSEILTFPRTNLQSSPTCYWPDHEGSKCHIHETTRQHPRKPGSVTPSGVFSRPTSKPNLETSTQLYVSQVDWSALLRQHQHSHSDSFDTSHQLRSSDSDITVQADFAVTTMTAEQSLYLSLPSTPTLPRQANTCQSWSKFQNFYCVFRSSQKNNI